MKKMSNTHVCFVVSLVLYLLIFGFSSPAFACFAIKPDPPDVWISGDACSGEILVVIRDFTTYGSGPGANCGCALNLPQLYGTVISAEIIDVASGLPLPQFSFSSNTNTGDGFDAISPADWQGFSSGVTAVVNAGIPVDLHFRVVPGPYIPCANLNDELALFFENASAVVGTAGVDVAGFPTEHIGILAAGAVTVSEQYLPGIQIQYSGFQPPAAPGPLYNNDTIFFYVNNISTIANDDTAEMSFTMRNLGELDLTYEIIDAASTTLTLSHEDGERASPRTASVIDHPFVVRRTNSILPTPPLETDNVDLVLDDSSVESAIGIGGGEWLWMNQFSPAQFPFELDSIAVAWDSTVSVGDLFDVYIYEDIDGDGDFSNAINVGVEIGLPVVDVSGFWSGYSITPLTLNGPGDVLIAVVNSGAGTGIDDFPALGDDDFYHGRSWAGIYSAAIVGPPTFPADLVWGKIGDFGLPTNWLVRGHGTWAGGCDWISGVSPATGIIEGGGQTTVTITADHVQAPGVYYCNLTIFSNDTEAPEYKITVCLNVLKDCWAEFSTEVQSVPPGNLIAPLDSIRDLFTFINHTLLETRVSIETKWLRNTGQVQQQMNPRQPVLLPFEENGNRNKKFEVPETMPLGTNYVVSIITTDDGADTICVDTAEFEVVAAAAKAEMLGLVSSSAGLPTTLDLHANYPNPFNPSTTIKYDLNEDLHVKINVYNLLGQHVTTLVDGFQKAGYRRVEWDGRNFTGKQVASGIYIYRMETANFTKSRKMLLSK